MFWNFVILIVLMSGESVLAALKRTLGTVFVVVCLMIGKIFLRIIFLLIVGVRSDIVCNIVK